MPTQTYPELLAMIRTGELPVPEMRVEKLPEPDRAIERLLSEVRPSNAQAVLATVVQIVRRETADVQLPAVVAWLAVRLGIAPSDLYGFIAVCAAAWRYFRSKSST